jgi:hypothetical protein
LYLGVNFSNESEVGTLPSKSIILKNINETK